MVETKILDTISENNLIEKNDVLVVAVSGGPDSMCLLDNLIKLKEKLQIKEIVVAHVNHMLRKEAEQETLYVQDYCKKNNVECFIKYVDIIKISQEEKIGTEEAGRIERYKFFDNIFEQKNANKIAIAHNLNDNAETILMHIIRGSGISGLCGITAKRDGKYIRPLINCSREEIEEYCKVNKLYPKYDSSNNDNTYTRNKIRNELIPYIKEKYNPNIIETLDRLSKLVRQEEEYMEKITVDTYKNIVIEENIEKFQIILNLKKFNELEYIVKARLIRYCAKTLFSASSQIEKKHIEDIIKLCQNNIGNKYLTPNKNFKIMQKNKNLYLMKI